MTLLLSREPFYGLVDPALLRMSARHLCFLEAARPFDLAVVLGAPESQVMPIWEKLVEEGRIARDDQGYWRPTSGMNELAMARFGSPLSRPSAGGLLAQLMVNAATVNHLPATASEFYVSRLVVFGSYLDESKDKLGDLDIGWESAERPGTREQMVASVLGGADPFRRTETMLRPKGPYVRLMPMSEVLKLGAPYREIYRFAPPAGTTAGTGSRKRARHC
ncbi:hypothetical protein PQR33_36185 [Paraburkholderia sediminicola]|uniref:hypothetical protein n=1 Tax=Paraburkholderia sediminicola TaxID=458836 RepID=UPI0038BD1D23